ncbi:MAG: glycosyltransferase family 1 protein [Chitinophagaceae bacterium]
MLKNSSLTSWQCLKNTDLICFSHLRWNFIYQRPQHLLSRFANYTRVFFVEEPIFHDAPDKLHINEPITNVYVVVPHLRHGYNEQEIIAVQKKMINNLISVMEINSYYTWYYTPMALPFTRHLKPSLTIYDCMDELSAFKFAPSILRDREKKLLETADIVFTGGYSIYEAKKNQHNYIYPFPSSIDKEHFSNARIIKEDPSDQAHIPHPRFGFYGVIDERFDIEMISLAAAMRQDWQFVLIGPIIKIDPVTLPHLDNIHYLGSKNYNELPHYLSGWDVAIIPFALNESTKYISPTKTPEYLAAGKPVISSPIKDVVSPYADNKLVSIAEDAKAFVKKGDSFLKRKHSKSWLTKVDAFLAGNSWDKTWSEMVNHIESKVSSKTKIKRSKSKEKIYV